MTIYCFCTCYGCGGGAFFSHPFFQDNIRAWNVPLKLWNQVTASMCNHMHQHLCARKNLKHWKPYHCLDTHKYCIPWQKWVALFLRLLCLTQARRPRFPHKGQWVLKKIIRGWRYSPPFPEPGSWCRRCGRPFLQSTGQWLLAADRLPQRSGPPVTIIIITVTRQW